MAKRKKSKKKSTKILAKRIKDKDGKFKIFPKKPAYLNKHPIFSFTHYIDSNKNWSFKCIKNCKEFWKLFENLKKMSSLTWGEIIQSSTFHGHEVSWQKDTLPNIVKNLPEEIKNFSLFIFKIFKDCRIIGFFNVNSVFEILFVDRYHKIFTDKRK